MSVAVAVTRSMPTKESAPAVACKLVQVRVASALSVSSAKPKLALSSLRPICSALPPFRPTKALMLPPPIASRSALTTSPPVLSESVPLSLMVLLLFSSEMNPLKVTKLKRLSSRLPLARVSCPKAPSLSRVTVTPGPARTSSWRAPWSTTRSAAPPVPAMPRLISTLRSVALAVKLSMPTMLIALALALRVLKLRALAVLPLDSFSVIKARPKSTPERLKPMALALPPLMPAKACRALPPRVSKSVWILLGALASAGSSDRLPSLRKKLSVRFSIAKLPATCKKPKASISRLALARSKRPCAPFIRRSNVLLMPVATLRAVLRSVVLPVFKL